MINLKANVEGLIMGKTKYVIALTDAERQYAQNVVNDKTTAPTFKKRAQILLALDTNAGATAIQVEVARRVGVTAPTIFNTIKAFSEEGLAATLQFKTPIEPNKKPIVSGEIEARIIATACGTPPEGFGRWTVRSLANKIELDIAPGISRETVRRVLKKLNLSLI
jgi:transposase